MRKLFLSLALASSALAVTSGVAQELCPVDGESRVYKLSIAVDGTAMCFWPGIDCIVGGGH